MLRIDDTGTGNVIDISAETLEELNGRLELSGSDNVVRIGAGCTSGSRFDVHLGDRCSFTTAERVTMGDLFVAAHHDGHVSVGADTGFNGVVRLSLHEPGLIGIGHGCLLADGVEVSTSDMHSIVDVASGLRINPPKDVRIGDHVWVARGCQVLKGTTIGDGAVVGAGSLTSGRLEAYCIHAGVPARKIRSGATWDFRLLPVRSGKVRRIRRWKSLVPFRRQLGAVRRRVRGNGT